MGTPDHLICLQRNLYGGQEARVRILYGTADWFRIEKRVWQGWLLSMYLFNLYAEHIMWNSRLDELQTRIKIARRTINNFRYVNDTTLMGESEEEVKSLLMRVKEESEKASLKLNIKNSKIMASGHITSWQIEGEKIEPVTHFLFLDSKITADGEIRHELRRWLLLAGKLWQTWKWKALSHVRLFVTPWTVALQTPLSTEFSRQECWSRLPNLLQEIFPTQGLNPGLQHCRHTLYHLSNNSVLKSKDITLPTKVHIAKATVSPAVMYDVKTGQ